MVLGFFSKPEGHVKFIGVKIEEELVVAGIMVVLIMSIVVLLEIVQTYEPSVL